MESTLTTINLLPSTREQIESFAQKTIDEVKSGNENALTLKIKLSAIKKCIELIEDGIKEYYMHEAGKFGAKVFETQGAKLEISDNLGVKYDYSQCNDPQIDNATRIKKEREVFLKNLKEPMEVVFEGGQVYTLNPPKKTSSTGLKITLI